ncbi:MAG TPA: hypothetical protein VNT30_01060 [Stellaceae bacterium]|nr:hypothetical protein [Stellaceae bacterium]
MRGLPILVLAFLLALPMAQASAAASNTPTAASARQPLVARAGLHEGFGRLAIDVAEGGPDSSSIQASVEQNQLTIRFAAPVSGSVASLQRTLSPYITDLAIGPDGLSLSGTLRRPVALQQKSYSPKTFVLDLIDQPDVASNASPTVKNAKPATEAEPAQPASAKTAPIPKPATPLTARLAHHAGFDRLVIDGAKPVTIGEAGGAAVMRFAKPVAIDLAALGKLAPTDAGGPSLSEDGQTLTLPLPADRRLRPSQAGRQVVLDLLAPDPKLAAQAAAQAAAAKAAATAAAAEKSAPVAKPVVSQSTAAALPVRVLPIDGGAGVSLRFEWNDPVAAAVFRRKGKLWIAFDAPAKPVIDPLSPAARAVLSTILPIDQSAATLLRLEAAAGVNPSVRRSGTVWIIDLRVQPLKPDAPIEPKIGPGTPATAVSFPALDPSSPISVIDPDVGDTLFIVTLPQLGQGIDADLGFVDFETLASVQGLAFRPNSELVTIRSRPRFVEVTAAGGLTVSPPGDRNPTLASMTGTAPSVDKGPPRLFAFDAWRGPAGVDFSKQRQTLQQAVVDVPAADRGPARLALARFYFANGMGPEALGVLHAIEHDTPALATTADFHAMRGASELLVGDRDAAQTDLADAALDNDRDASLWRGAVALAKGDFPAAAKNFADGNSALATYPKPVRHRLTLDAAEASLQAGDIKVVEPLLASVLREAPMAGDLARARYLEGLRLEKAGDHDRAVKTWAEVSASDDGPSRARSTYASILDRLASGKLDRVDAIDQLQRLRFAWRGDDFEVTVLRKLAQLQVDDSDYRGGFRSFRTLLETYPDQAPAKGAAEEMQADFVGLFLGKSAENVAPLKALAVYDEFRELMPADERGQEITRKLIDRLVSVDLLDRAATLLDDQARNHLQGLEQARVAARLALVRLLDHKPDDALKALDIPVIQDLGPDLNRQRRELRARALAELGRTDDALKLLVGDASVDADRLRSDIYWHTQNWAAAAVLLQTSVKVLLADGTLDPESEKAVLNAATALALADDRAGLETWRQKYSAIMDKTPDRDAFRVVAGDPGDDVVSFRNLASKVAQVGELQSFMTAYRQRLASDKLSAIN